jgi:hypothetical protein
VRDRAYPEVSSSLQLKTIPSRDYLVCMQCTEGPKLEEDTDPLEWAQRHNSLKPWHDRFRIERFMNFSVPAEQAAEHPSS